MERIYHVSFKRSGPFTQSGMILPDTCKSY